MNRFKKGAAAAMVVVLVCLLCGGIIPAAAAEVILDPSLACGRDYTQSTQLADALEQVFSGDVDVFSDAACTMEVSMPLGSSMDNSTQYYVKSKTSGNKVSGWQCYIYANGVYNQLFREWVGHANGFAHSERVVSGGGNALSYEILTDAGVRCGAYLRTTGNSDGSYSSNVGHSMILLTYDETSITYLEGNADGNGLVRITTRTWSDFNQRQLSGRSRYIAHIAQPKAAVYEQLYPICAHEHYDATGLCSSCGWQFDWEGTLLPGTAGQYQVNEEVTPRQTPYEAMISTAQKLQPGQMVQVQGTYVNAFGEPWCAYTDSDGNGYFLPASCLQFVEPLPLEVVIRDFSPPDQAVLERKSQPVLGMVQSNYPIESITAYLDGAQYALWTPPNQQTMTVNLQATDVNYRLPFSKLTKGRHTITLTLRSFLHEETMTIHESVFYMEENIPCSHQYQSQVTQPPSCTQEGVQTYTCSLCAHTYTQPLAVVQHQYDQGSCTVCGAFEQATLIGTVRSAFDEATPTVVILRRGTAVAAQTTVEGLEGTYTFQDLQPGSYTLELSKTGGVTRSVALSLEVGTVTHSAMICQPGDVNEDGRVNVRDTARLYSHIRGTNLITQLYPQQCADMNADDTINIFDISRLYAKIKAV